LEHSTSPLNPSPPRVSDFFFVWADFLHLPHEPPSTRYSRPQLKPEFSCPPFRCASPMVLHKSAPFSLFRIAHQTPKDFIDSHTFFFMFCHLSPPPATPLGPRKKPPFFRCHSCPSCTARRLLNHLIAFPLTCCERLFVVNPPGLLTLVFLQTPSPFFLARGQAHPSNPPAILGLVNKCRAQKNCPLSQLDQNDPSPFLLYNTLFFFFWSACPAFLRRIVVDWGVTAVFFFFFDCWQSDSPLPSFVLQVGFFFFVTTRQRA